ncbi:hypothetical protein Ocin01_07917, partial [Orchesella cincta]
SNQHLWNLLQGRVVVATDDVVLEELQENVTRIRDALTYYKPYQSKDGEEKIKFPALPKVMRDDWSDEVSKKTDDTTASSTAKKSSETTTSSFDQLRKAIAQQLNIIETFRTMISYQKWCKGLLNSIEVAKNEVEVIEIIHCLLLLTYKLPNEAILEYFTYLNTNGFANLRKSEAMKMAEGTTMYSALLVAGITDCCSSVFPQEFGPVIRDFVSKNFETLLLNPYNIGAVFACYDFFCKEDQEMTLKMKRIPCNPSVTFTAMMTLAEHYGKNSLRDRHSISLTVSASMFEAFESLLANYDINHFGTNTQGFLILSKILQHNTVAENFLCGTPLALTALYTDATSVFPIDIPSTLHLWKSLCMSVRTKDNCNTLISGVAKLNCIAEYLDDEISSYTKRNGEFGIMNLRSRNVFGVAVDRGVNGTVNTYEDIPYISWELPSSMEANAFSVIRSIIGPMAQQIDELEKVYRAPPSEYENFDYMPKVVFAVAEFIIQFMQNTDAAIDEITYLVHPTCIILERMLKNVRDTEEKQNLLKHLLGIVGAVNEFLYDKVTLFNYIYDVLPGSDKVSIVENMILRRESISLTRCEVTLSFLGLVASFAENENSWKQGHDSTFESKFVKSIAFISENILSACPIWRVGNDGIRLQIYSKCLEIFTTIYSLKGRDWDELKRECIKFLIAPSSCLLILLTTDESSLQDSIIRPSEDNKILVDVVCAALKLLHKVILFEKRVLVALNRIWEGSLVSVLGVHTRHRLNPLIPTLTMMILKEIAEHSNMSMLSGFGSDETAFRDVMIQRLEFIAEDINLKIAVLDFLTVISQTQTSIMQCFFKDGTLENNVLDLIQGHEDISAACLHFFRSLFRQNLPVPRSRAGFWTTIFTPINYLSRGSKIEIVAATLHIVIFELYSDGINDPHFCAELEQFMKTDQLRIVVDVVIEETSEKSNKCLLALKHFFLLVLGRPELSRLVTKDVVTEIQSVMLEGFWKVCEEEVEDRQRCKTLSELVTILTTPETATVEFVAELLLKLIKSFKFHSFGVKLSLLCLVNKCYMHCKETLRDGVIENTLRIIRKVFDSSINLVEMMDNEESYPILAATSTLMTTIVEKQPFDVWGSSFEKELIPLSLLSIACVGIMKQKAPNVVSNCLSALITLAEHPQGCKLLPTTGMSKRLWLHLYKFTDDVCDVEWSNIFLFCLNLNSKLLGSQKRNYLDEALAFWGLYSNYLNHKLSLMMNLTETCVVVDDTDKGYNDMKAVLSCNAFVLNDILMLMPYLEEWQKSQPAEVFKSIKGVFYVLQEACSLLRQPLLLQSSLISKSKSMSSELKLSPKLLEMQTRLWEICDISMHILVKLKSKEEEFIEKSALIPTMFQTGQLCIKALTKGERKYHSGINVTSRVSSILEKVMLMVYNFTIPVLDDASGDIKFQIAFRRELGTEVVSLIDGIRRLSIPKNDFLITICSKMETKFK